MTLTTTSAPPSWQNWKSMLLDPGDDRAVGPGTHSLYTALDPHEVILTWPRHDIIALLASSAAADHLLIHAATSTPSPSRRKPTPPAGADANWQASSEGWPTSNPARNSASLIDSPSTRRRVAQPPIFGRRFMTVPVSPSGADQLLDADTVLPYLHARGVLGSDRGSATVLSGGVSNVVLLVETASERVVFKQALAKLRVADDWYADPARAQAEAAALRILTALTPHDVPALLDSDAARHTLTITAAPPGWRTWKQDLFHGKCNAAVASWLGTVLATWHQGTQHASLPTELDGVEAFRQLRLEPYLGVSAKRRPDLAESLHAYSDALLSRRQCLISGDFSPKNVLVGDGRGWVIDLEVAHRGDPAFDVAFLLHHLLLKAVALSAHRDSLRDCATAFLTAYGEGLGAADPAHLHGVIGCLLLARVIGSSPVDYLSPAQAAHIQTTAAELLSDPPAEFRTVWTRVMKP